MHADLLWLMQTWRLVLAVQNAPLGKGCLGYAQSAETGTGTFDFGYVYYTYTHFQTPDCKAALKCFTLTPAATQVTT